MTSTKYKIKIIDDHRIFADGLCTMLQQFDSNFDVSTQYTIQLESDYLKELSEIDLLLIDIHMPNMSGFNLLQALSNRGIKIKVLIISGSDEITDVEKALRLGAQGFIPKSLPSREMVTGVKKVLNGERFLPSYLADSVNWSACNPKLKSNNQAITVDGLRERQIEVLRLMHQGYSNNKIASILDISESAVKSHISIIFKALNTKNRTSAIKCAVDLGLI